MEDLRLKGLFENRLKALGVSIAVIASSQAALISTASANGYHFLHQSAEGAGSAYATNGTAGESISAMFSNPSSISRFQGTNVSIGGTIDLPSNKIFNMTATAPFTDGAVAVEGNPDEPKNPLDTAYGATFYYSNELTPLWTLGFSITAPFAYVSDYPETAKSRYTATHTSLVAPNISPSLSYKVNDQWSVGGSLNYQHYSAEIGTQVATSLNPSIDTDVSSLIEADDGAFGFSLGFEYQPNEDTRIGVSYRSEIKHDFEGDFALTGSDANLTALQSLISITGLTANAQFEIETPSMLQFGLLQKLTSTTELYANANYFGWSAFKDTVVSYDNGLDNTVVDNNWDDSWYLAVGLGHQYSQNIKLRTGFAYDWTPTPESAVSPRAPNYDRWNLGFGMTYTVNPQLHFDLAYQYARFEDVKINLAGGNNVSRGTLEADFELDAHILSAQANYQF